MTTRVDAFAVTVDPGMTVREGEWDGARGEREIFDWATGEDGEVDWAKAARGFIIADLNPPAGENITRASFKLAIAYVENGELVGIGNAIRNALARLPQTFDLSDAVQAEAKAKLEGMLEKLRAEHDRADKIALPDEATAKAWVVEHLLDARKMPRPRMVALKGLEDRYAWLKPPHVDVVYRGLRNLTRRAADQRDGLKHPSDPVRDKSWTTSRTVADEYALAEHTIEDREEDRVGAVIEARANSSSLLLNADEMAKTAGIGDVIHPDDGKPLRDMILADREVIALDSLDVVTVHVLPYEDNATLDGFAAKLRGVAALPPAKRQSAGWTDKAIAGALALLTSMMPSQVQADAAERVYRTCTMDFALDSEARVAIDRALAIADEIGPRTDAAQVNSIAERLRADGFADKVTSDGRLIVTGYAARTGSQLYGDGKSTWYEYRSEDEVESSLAGYGNATFTDDHPPMLVTSDNWREYARGHVGAGAVLLPPDDDDGHRYVKVTICVGDVAVIRKMRDGKVELSAGYTTIAVRDPGVDAQGIRYTYRQTDIQINHLALVDEGRAGHRARVYIDGQSAVFEIDSKEDDMTTKLKTDQLEPEALMALIDAIKAYAYAESPEAADAAIQTIATVTGGDLEMLKQALGGGEMMEMDGIKLRVSKDTATRIRAAQTKANSDAAKLTNDHAALQGEVTALARTVTKLEADKAAADMRDLEREIAPHCPQLVSTWSTGKRPDSMTAMRVAAILDLDSHLKDDLDAAMGADPAKPAPTFDAFVGSLYRSTIRHASARKGNNDGPALPSFAEPKIDISSVYGKTPATN